MINRISLYNLFGLIIALVFIPGHAFAGTMILDSFTDQTTNPINLPATKLLVATDSTNATASGNDVMTKTVSVAGTVVLADIAPNWAMRTGETE